jgi:SAM-dependent methyltransferase
MNILQCDEEKWKLAQKFEVHVWSQFSKNGDDWNFWWERNFENYSFLKDKQENIHDIIEVGCGPYSNNLKIILNNIKFSNIKSLTVEDPLLNTYVEMGCSVSELKKSNAVFIPTSIENMNTDKKYDMIICINVLDHVMNAEVCINKLKDILNENGILILGQDLTNDNDLKIDRVRNDVGHPIKLEHDYILGNFSDFEKVYFKILNRESGRNPIAHYGTLLLAAKKRKNV